jgi:uncharacterized RDD family membrane protein YckC
MASPDPTEPSPAHPWRRLAAAVIDAFILLVPCAALIYVHPLLALVAAIAYGTLFEATGRHATPGKRVCGVDVAASTAGGMRVMPGLLRNLLKYGSLGFSASVWGFLVPLALFAPAFATQRQGLHDLVARTIVRHERGAGLSDLAVGAIGLFGPIVFVVALLPLILAPVTNARARESVEAAMRGAAERKAHVEGYAAASGRLPADSAIVLHPEGLNGSITLTPEMRGNAVHWVCTAQGIMRGRLPKECRTEY